MNAFFSSKFNWIFLLLLIVHAESQAQKKEIGNLVLDNVPEINPNLLSSLEQYQSVRTASFSSWDKEGKGMFISTRFGEVAQIHYVASAGADRQQITFSKEPLNNALVCPDKSRNGFLFLKDQGGNENYQIYYFDLNTAQTSLLTDGKTRNLNPIWDSEGKSFVYSSNKRTGADLDFYVKTLDKPNEEKMIFQGKGGGWSVNDWSKDKKQMLVTEYISINESRLYLLLVEEGSTIQINDNPKKKIAYSNALFSKDGKGVYFVADEDTEFMTLRYYDLESKKIKNISEKILADVDHFDLSHDGKYVAFSCNEGGYSRSYMLNTKDASYAKIPEIKEGVINSLHFNPYNNQLAYSFTNFETPGDVFVIDFDQSDSPKYPKRWTFSETAELSPTVFIAPSLIEYPTFDMLDNAPRKIPAFQYLPKKSNGKPFPVVIYIHGGPEGQSLPNFNPFIQFMANELGIAILVPNVRGSTGYGKTYLKLDNAALRENSVKDIGALLDWIKTQDKLNADKVAVYGGSYGGYMSLACMTNYNDRLACGVDLFGISNFVTFLKNTSPYRQDLRRAEYGDERDPKMNEILVKISPLTNIKDITKPMFVFQGKNDPRVPLSESEQMVEQLKAQGNIVWYVMAKDEGHGITKKSNREYVTVSVAAFLKEFLLK